MSLLRGPVVWATEVPLVRKLIERTRLGRAVAGRFVAGATLEDGMAAALALHGQGVATILDHLGENVDSPAMAAEAAEGYIRALRRIRESPDVDCCISVKLTQLGLDQSVGVCRENMERVLRAAAEADPPTLVMVDMEAFEYVDRTLDVYVELRERFPALGVAVQAYLRRALDDVRRIARSGAIVRMTKGAYFERADVAFETRREVARSYVELSKLLLDSGATVHFATHDSRLINGAREYVRRTSVSRERYEFQMLYGIRRDLQAELIAGGEPVRVYVPYGTQWYPYLTRRMAERPANLWFFVSNLLRWRG